MTQTTKHRGIGIAMLLLAIVGLAAAAYWRARPQGAPGMAAAQAQHDLDPEADRILRGMGEYMSGLHSFRVAADSTFEVVLDNGQRLEFLAESHVEIRRPDRLRSERRGPLADLVLYYDGDSMTLHGRRMNLFATIDAPHDLDHAIDFARDELELDAPAADLLASDVYGTLTADVRSSMYVGQEEVNGVMAHHLAFRNRGRTDWQIWVQDGATPLPVRYVVVSTDVRSQPAFTVSLHDWDTQSPVSDADFQFEAPAGARQIQFRRAVELREARTPAGRPGHRGGQ